MQERLTNETITDPINRSLIEALWHSSKPLSPESYVSEYTEHGGSSTYVDVIASRLDQLASDGVVRVDGAETGTEKFYVLGGDNASEAVRRLGLTGDGGHEL